MVVGFYNVENLFDTIDDPLKMDEDFLPDGPHHNTRAVYEARIHNTASVLAKLGTDVSPDGPAIIGLAEVENSTVLGDLARQPEIAGRGYRYICFNTPDVRGISVGLLYNPRYLKVLSSRPIHVPLESIGSHRPTRDVLYVTGILAGDTMHILVNHWPSKSGGEAVSAPARRVAALVNKKIVDSLNKINPNAKIIIMGDFNDNPTSEGIAEVMAAKAEKQHLKNSDLYNPWVNMYRKGLGTERYQGEWNLIDQIMVSGTLVKSAAPSWKYYGAEIFNRDFLRHMVGKEKGLPHRAYTISQVWDNGNSDHFPVLLYLVK